MVTVVSLLIVLLGLIWTWLGLLNPMIDTALCDSIANPVKIKIILLFMTSEKKQFSLNT